MTNPTSNFGWQMPTSTDLVTDLPADFEVFGQAVDTSMADLKGGTTGQILSKATNADMDFTWITNDVGDITAVNVTAPITGGGTSGAVTIGVDAASTSAAGVVQLSDSTSTTSSVLASTPTATKSAYDLAAAAIPKSTVTTAGDVIYRNGSAPTRLGIGTAGQVLTVNSGATAPEWTTVAGSGFVQIAQSVLTSSAASVVFSSIPTTYTNLKVVYQIRSTAAGTGDVILMRLNGDTSANYDVEVFRNYGGTAQAFEVFGGTYFELGTIAGNTAAAALSGTGVIDIANYKRTTFDKSVISRNGNKESTSSGSLRNTQTIGYWRSAAAINSITLFGGGNIATGSVVTLYGEL